MKHVKISCIGFIVLSFLAIQLMLFASSQAGYPLGIQALDEDLYKKKSQSSPGNTNSAGTTQNNDSSSLIFSEPFYLSNDTLILDKILIENSSTINREVQFFVERGFINTSLVTYNVGYYVEDSNLSGSSSESNPLRNNLEAGSGPNYAKGSGFFLTENGGIIKWDAFDQIINKSDDTFLYAGMISFSPTDGKNNVLSFLKNHVGLYEFSIDSNNTTTSTTNTTTTTHRTIWLWS